MRVATAHWRPAWSGAWALVALLLAGTPAAAGLLVAVGDVTATEALLWVRGVAAGEIRVEYGPRGEAARTSAALQVSPGRDLTGLLRLEGLRPGARHAYRVLGAGETVEGEFVTAPEPDRPAPVTLAWSGDLGSTRNCRPATGGYPIFETLRARRPDLFLFVGDTIYADHTCGTGTFAPGADFVATTVEGYRAKHRYQREDPAVQAFLRSASVVAIWDDHEVRNDFAGTEDPLMPAGREAFLEWWPILPPAEAPGRLHRRLRWGGLLEIFVLDTRQYRSANAEPDGPGKTMLGAAQRRWVVDGVAGSPATWKVVVSSVPLSVPTGRIHRDSWSSANRLGVPEEGGTGFATERDAILRELRQRGVRNLVVLAADVHFAALIRHHPWPDFSFHEFIAGPLAASLAQPRPLDQALGPRLLFARGGVRNFGELVVEPGVLTVRIVDEGGAVLFTHTLGAE